MPQLVKGGKYVFGWSRVYWQGCLTIPPEAFQEYGFIPDQRVIIMSGSRTSGGFAVTTKEKLQQTRLAGILALCPSLGDFSVPPSEAQFINARTYCWETLKQNQLCLSLETLTLYRVEAGDLLLSVRGSQVALAFCRTGPLVAEARKHSQLPIF